MSTSEPDPKPIDDSATIQGDLESAPTQTESEFILSAQHGVEPAITKIHDVHAADDNRFSLDEDTLTAIDDLGLQLVPVTDKNVMGRLAHYDIIRCLGRGGMGTVFEAFDTKLYRPVAIKFMASSLAASSKARSRFLREARVAASINHPNVVTIHSVDEYENRPYLVMEFVPGITLQDQVRNFGPMALGDVLRISRQIATGLRAAHEKGIVHRDIKPGNILLENGVQRVKIVDFGLAQVVFELSDITSQGQTLGTPRYMAPEQIEGSRVDERADIFSLGCVIYMMCCGQPPFSGNTYTILQNILREKQVPIQQVMPQMPQALSDLVERMLSKSPETRVQTATEVENTLMEITRGGTPSDEYLRVPGRTDSRTTEPKPSTMRRATAVAAIVGIVAVLAVLNRDSLFARKAKEDLAAQAMQVKIDSTALAQVVPDIAEVPFEDRKPRTMTVGGESSNFPSLQQALLHVQAGDTLTVAGELPADDTILLNNPLRHSNLTIDWAASIPMKVTRAGLAAVTVDAVPGILIRDATIFVENTHAVSIQGHCGGLTFENCRFEQGNGSRQAVIAIWASAQGTEQSPIAIKHCDVIFYDLGVACVGDDSSTIEWLRFEDNVFHGLKPKWGTTLVFEKSVRNINVARNRIESVRTGISTRGVLSQMQFANNTFFQVFECCHPSPDSAATSVTVHGNLAVQCVEFAPGITSQDAGLTFAFNKSDIASGQPGIFDSVSNIEFVSTDFQNEAFLAPWADDQLKIASSPAYAGAVEPRSRPADSAKTSDDDSDANSVLEE